MRKQTVATKMTLAERLQARSAVSHTRLLQERAAEQKEAVELIAEVCDAQWPCVLSHLETSADTSDQYSAVVRLLDERFYGLDSRYARVAMVQYLKGSKT